MNKLKLIIICLLFINSSCNKIDRIYENKDFLLETFNDTDILRRGRSILMRVNVDTSSYSFWFYEKRISRKIIFHGAYDFNKLKNNPFSKEEVFEKLHMHMDIMKKFGIRAVGSDFKEQGINMKFYLKDKDVFYVEDVNNVTIKSWKSYVNSANKLDENWYWRERYSD